MRLSFYLIWASVVCLPLVALAQRGDLSQHRRQWTNVDCQDVIKSILRVEYITRNLGDLPRPPDAKSIDKKYSDSEFRAAQKSTTPFVATSVVVGDETTMVTGFRGEARDGNPGKYYVDVKKSNQKYPDREGDTPGSRTHEIVTRYTFKTTDKDGKTFCSLDEMSFSSISHDPRFLTKHYSETQCFPPVVASTMNILRPFRSIMDFNYPDDIETFRLKKRESLTCDAAERHLKSNVDPKTAVLTQPNQLPQQHPGQLSPGESGQHTFIEEQRPPASKKKKPRKDPVGTRL